MKMWTSTRQQEGTNVAESGWGDSNADDGIWNIFQWLPRTKYSNSIYFMKINALEIFFE